MAGMKKIRPIDANALAESIKRYMKDYRNAPTRLTVCRSILSMLGDENQTPTLTSDHFPDVKKMVPLTLEQLRGMDGQPVWVTPAGFWALVIAKRGQRVQLICNDGEKVWADKEIELVGPVYAYPPSHINQDCGKDRNVPTNSTHIDREAWVSVEDAMPPEHEPVLCIVNGKPKPNITLEDAYQLGSWNKTDGWIIDEFLDWEDADVSWWMTLPAPPGKEW